MRGGGRLRNALEAVRLRLPAPPADISIFFKFVPPPYGGGNQFLLALRGELARRGLRIENNRISRETRACLCNSFNFDGARLARVRHADCRVVHRVDGPVGAMRGDSAALDREICALNREIADATVFQSEYSLRSHLALGLEFREPAVVPNAADASIFHPRGRVPFDPGRKIRLISAAWSDNPNKGGDVYAWLDEHLDWERYEYTFVGRSRVQFRNIRMMAPVPSAPLAELLRAHDVYVTATRHDPCSNALLEALSCGLPAIYLASGGNAELARDAGFAFTAAEEVPALLDRLVTEYDARQARISVLSIAEVADRYLRVMGLA